MIRSFIAIPLPREVRLSLASLQSAIPAGRSSDPDNLHLTLAFLAEQPEDRLEEFHFALEDLACPGFDIRIEGLGGFGKFPPRVLYAAVHPEPALSNLRRKVRNAARQSGIDLPHERFVPHITLARFNRTLSPDDGTRLDTFLQKRAGFSLPTFPAERFVMFRSTLGRNGPVYDELTSYDLA